ncbi:hypothetical protein Ahy_B04g072521 isoform A [Arachis hypogaea]|uniref:MULE transposase domain-containing protein n=1 Tax=Arachis hypogaea TaxID=3818 RepID=A0A444ZN84_ARAHY|nr:hypothetical protein Ahy_B04g072521 isoform A [Arachis hypogaea]
MKEKNPNFFFELELEDNQSIKLAFWADARSRAACEYFRDVISFDTTYNTNKVYIGSFWVHRIIIRVHFVDNNSVFVVICFRYNLVCDFFVGVNHHGQSILLGCALMKNEEIKSFKWLFQYWLHCMGGNAPKGILTNQCASMKRALEACMPIIIHRWCIWHITKKIPSKLNGYKGHAEIQQEMSQVVWNSHNKDSFDRNWNNFLLKYGLVDNKWLSAIEAQFQHVYTHQKFREVQAQFRGKANCITKLTNSALGYSVYEVGEQASSSIFNKFVVTYDSVAAQVK